MTPKEYLSQIKYLDDEINTKIEQLDNLRSSITGISSPKLGDKVQTSNLSDFTDTVNKIIDEEQRLTEKIDQLVNLKCTINAQIEQLDNPLFRVILINYYVLGLNLAKISDKFGYEHGYTRKVHGWALQEFGNKYKNLFE